MSKISTASKMFAVVEFSENSGGGEVVVNKDWKTTKLIIRQSSKWMLYEITRIFYETSN